MLAGVRGTIGFIITVALALTLAACGSSSSRPATVSGSEFTATSTVASEAQATTETTSVATQATTSSIPIAGCRSVPPPPSRADEQASKATAELDPTHSYTVRLATNCGPIVIQLAVREAPKTASSFAHLVQTGYYNDLTFHRIVPGFVIQGGDPRGDGTGGPSWEVVEPPPANLRYTKGVVAMAKSPTAASGASGSQFFIVTAANAGLPAVYALVGRVVSGEKAVEAISHAPTETAAEGGQESKPRAPIVIERATLSVH
jgi:cyclophilin family peptidyl-prolyl cis-trans isomerase